MDDTTVRHLMCYFYDRNILFHEFNIFDVRLLDNPRNYRACVGWLVDAGVPGWRLPGSAAT